MAEDGRHPNRLVHREPNKPAEQQIVVHLLHQLAFRANRIERLQQQSAQQFLGRDRGAARVGINRVEPVGQMCKSGIGNLADSPQRMVRRNPAIRPHVAEKPLVVVVRAVHRVLASRETDQKRIRYARVATRSFSAAC